MRLRVIDATELRRALPMSVAIDALETAFRTQLPSAPLRSNVETPAGSLLLMPSSSEDALGVKLVTLTPTNAGRGLPYIHALYALFDGATQAPRAILDGAALTALRTGAVSGLATRRLAVPEASRLVVFGAGVQARSHIEAMRAVRPVERVTIVSRSTPAAEALVDALRAEGLDAGVGVPDVVAEADLVCTCTTSPEPVLEGRLLAPGTHVNAVGAYTPETRELDGEAVRRARVVVETREVAMAEAGDLLIPIREGIVGVDHVAADLAELVAGAPVRRSPRDVTVFVSVGVAFEDLVVARAAVERVAP
ncbi:MAG TPA: ornithine cyclodeaminase family protein [Actinomycetota bacterium]|nr:ornithine cyclodeaminase family protein [Actinomycetota bacterium]